MQARLAKREEEGAVLPGWSCRRKPLGPGVAGTEAGSHLSQREEPAAAPRRERSAVRPLHEQAAKITAPSAKVERNTLHDLKCL